MIIEAPQRIAVIQTGSLSEVTFVSPLIRALRRAWPAARVVLATRPDVSSIAAFIPGIEAVISFDEDGADRGLAAIKRVARALGELQLVLVPHFTLRSALLAWLTKARNRVGIGFPVKGRLFTIKVAMRLREPYVERALDLVRVLGIDGSTELELKPSAAHLERASALLGATPSVGMIIGSPWPSKRWPAESFAKLCQRVEDAGLRPVLFGSPYDRPIAQAIHAAAGIPVLDLIGIPLAETAAALCLMKGVVGGDSGLTHVARAVGVPTVLLFGPTDPGAHTLEPHAQALRLGLECQPCMPESAYECPKGHQECLRSLDPHRVYGALASLVRCEEG